MFLCKNLPPPQLWPHPTPWYHDLDKLEFSLQCTCFSGHSVPGKKIEDFLYIFQFFPWRTENWWKSKIPTPFIYQIDRPNMKCRRTSLFSAIGVRNSYQSASLEFESCWDLYKFYYSTCKYVIYGYDKLNAFSNKQFTI